MYGLFLHLYKMRNSLIASVSALEGDINNVGAPCLSGLGVSVFTLVLLLLYEHFGVHTKFISFATEFPH